MYLSMYISHIEVRGENMSQDNIKDEVTKNIDNISRKNSRNSIYADSRQLTPVNANMYL
jgi:hypothetical protein